MPCFQPQLIFVRSSLLHPIHTDLCRSQHAKAGVNFVLTEALGPASRTIIDRRITPSGLPCKQRLQLRYRTFLGRWTRVAFRLHSHRADDPTALRSHREWNPNLLRCAAQVHWSWQKARCCREPRLTRYRRCDRHPCSGISTLVGCSLK